MLIIKQRTKTRKRERKYLEVCYGNLRATIRPYTSLKRKKGNEGIRLVESYLEGLLIENKMTWLTLQRLGYNQYMYFLLVNALIIKDCSL